jgi:hypothetical protein
MAPHGRRSVFAGPFGIVVDAQGAAIARNRRQQMDACTEFVEMQSGRKRDTVIPGAAWEEDLARSVLGALPPIILGAVFVAAPGHAEPFTLAQALGLAYETNPQLEAQRAALRATDEEVAKALAGWRPAQQWKAATDLSMASIM